MVNESQADAARAFGLLRFRGPDARKFLQGQLSNDMALLAAERLTLAGYHNPQGRVLALLRLAAPDAEQVIALLARRTGRAHDGGAAALRAARQGRRSPTSPPPTRSQRSLSSCPCSPRSLTRTRAHAKDIAAGMPQVYGATSGLFVAQMLNLDCVEAISFTKGCYTGQEIIARAHYRGRIKRRMQRFLTDAARRARARARA